MPAWVVGLNGDADARDDAHGDPAAAHPGNEDGLARERDRHAPPALAGLLEDEVAAHRDQRDVPEVTELSGHMEHARDFVDFAIEPCSPDDDHALPLVRAGRTTEADYQTSRGLRKSS